MNICPNCSPNSKLKDLCENCKRIYNVQKSRNQEKILWRGRENLSECKLPPDEYIMTLQEIGTRMEISTERVRQIEKTALSKLKRGGKLNEFRRCS